MEILNNFRDLKEVIELVIWFAVLGISIYNVFRKPEKEQNLKIDRILEKLESIETKEIETLKSSIRLLIRQTFARLCYDCIKNGYVTMSDIDNVENLYQEYHNKFGMNGRGEELYKRVLDLPIKEIKKDE